MLRKTQLCWAGHVVRMPDERLPKRILYGELLTGARSHGGQKKRFKDTLKASLKDFGIDHNSWETTAQNRAAWRRAINKGAAAYESRRLETAKSKRATRKSRASSAPETHDPTRLPYPAQGASRPTPPPDMMKKVFILQERRTHRLIVGENGQKDSNRSVTFWILQTNSLIDSRFLKKSRYNRNINILTDPHTQTQIAFPLPSLASIKYLDRSI